MRLKSKIAALVCAALTAASLFSCHGSRGLPEFIIPEEFDTSRQHEITFWAKNDTNINQTRIYEKAFSDFEAIYPNIKVNMRLYTDYGKIYNDVITNIATNTTPDVCITYPDHIATYLTGENTVVPLDELAADPKYGLGGSEIKFDSPSKDEIIPQFLSECKIEGILYALPFMRSTEACYINKTFVEKLGYELPETLSWDFVWEVSEAAVKQDADGNYLLNGQKVMIPFIYKSTDNMMIQLLRQSGGGYSDENGNISLFNDTTKDILLTVAEHVKTGAFSTFKISSYPANFLNAGQCVFAIDSTAGSTWMGSEAPLSDISEDKFIEFETAVMPIPQLDADNPRMISQGPSVCVFNKADPQRVMASWLFVQYLLSNEVQIAYSKTEGYVPVTEKAQDSEEYKDYLSRAGEDTNEHYKVKIDTVKLLLSNIDNTFVTPVFNGSASLRSAAGQLIENTAKSVRRGETVDDAYIENLYSSVTSLYRLDALGENTASGGEFTEALPAGSKALLFCLCAAWVGILIYITKEKIKITKKDNINAKTNKMT